MSSNARAWIRFLRGYGPIAQNDNMYDETVQRHARQCRVRPIEFDHPRLPDVERAVLEDRRTVILTGTAGDGKTHLCRQVWERLGGAPEAWEQDDPHLAVRQRVAGRPAQLHVIRDLSAWVPPQGRPWAAKKADLLTAFCQSLYEESNGQLYLIAANDGQLIESLRRLKCRSATQDRTVSDAYRDLESLLIKGRERMPGVRVQMFNLSRSGSVDLYDLALTALLEHEGWQACYDAKGMGTFFGPECPIRRNYELLKTPLVQKRIRQLLELCYFNDFHVPIRQILLMLVNAILGHPDVPGKLMRPSHVGQIIDNGTRSKASLYDNIVGYNLLESRRNTILIFRFLSHFRIGLETSNRIDGRLIYGQKSTQELIHLAEDPVYGADVEFWQGRTDYIEAEDESGAQARAFLKLLVRMRRALFFLHPGGDELWELTSFRWAGSYLRDIVGRLSTGQDIPPKLRGTLTRGLNRVFTGMHVADRKELLLAEGLVSSQARVSKLLKKRIRWSKRKGEKRVYLTISAGMPTLQVWLGQAKELQYELHLTRFEFLVQVAEGVLPSSFSNELYEDALAFKSQLLAALNRVDADHDGHGLRFDLLALDKKGYARPELLEVHHA